MLILTRRVGETLIIGDKVIHITVLGVKGCQVRLGVQAPKEVSVHREEIYLRIQAEKDSPPDEKGNLAHNGEQEISAHTLEHPHGTVDSSHPSLSIQHDTSSTHPITVDMKKVPSRSYEIKK